MTKEMLFSNLKLKISLIYGHATLINTIPSDLGS